MRRFCGGPKFLLPAAEFVGLSGRKVWPGISNTVYCVHLCYRVAYLDDFPRKNSNSVEP
jgi:hypothetical protein